MYSETEITNVDYEAVVEEARKNGLSEAMREIKRMALYPSKFHTLIFDDLKKSLQTATFILSLYKKQINTEGASVDTVAEIAFWESNLSALDNYIKYFNQLEDRLTGEWAKDSIKPNTKKEKKKLRELFRDEATGEKWERAISKFIHKKNGEVDTKQLNNKLASAYIHAVSKSLINKNDVFLFHERAQFLRNDNRYNNKSHDRGMSDSQLMITLSEILSQQ